MPPLTTSDAPGTDTSEAHTIPPVSDSAVASVTRFCVARAMMAAVSSNMTAVAHRVCGIGKRGAFYEKILSRRCPFLMA